MTHTTTRIRKAGPMVRDGLQRKTAPFGKPGQSMSLLLIAVMFLAGTALALFFGIPVKSVMSNYSYDVLVILIVMELFTNLIAGTGVMQLLAIKIARFSRGKRRLCLMMFGGMMFLISSCLNNITAVMMILPVVFVLLKTIEVDRRYVRVFFAVILALSNTGGAASPIGDFPAIVIMTSGITDFVSYLTHAFPLFALTSAALVLIWGMSVRKERDDGAALTRAQVVRMLLDAAGYGAVARLEGIFTCAYTDPETIPAGELGYAALAQGLGLVTGTYAGDRTATRAEAAVLLERLMDR